MFHDKSGISKGRIRFLLVMVLLAVALPFAPISSPATSTASAATRSTLSQYRAWMAEARIKYPYKQTVDKMYRTMMCESGGNAKISSPSGTYKGLFQYHINTWRGTWNPYRNASIWDAKSQIFATAKAWSIGMQRQWSCYTITAGR